MPNNGQMKLGTDTNGNGVIEWKEYKGTNE